MGFWKHTAINKVDIVFIVYKINLKKKKMLSAKCFYMVGRDDYPFEHSLSQYRLYERNLWVFFKLYM